MNPIEQAVMPLKTEAMNKASRFARELAEKAKADMEAGGWDLRKVAPYPNTNQSRATFQRALSRRKLILAVTEPDPDAPRDIHLRTEIRRMTSTLVDAFAAQAGADAGAQYDAFVAKLVSKIGECYGAQLQGNHVWGYSILNVWKHEKDVERWKTQQIVNVSKLGKVFNQWPTRKLKK